MAVMGWMHDESGCSGCLITVDAMLGVMAVDELDA